jgi:hypothetical protein
MQPVAARCNSAVAAVVDVAVPPVVVELDPPVVPVVVDLVTPVPRVVAGGGAAPGERPPATTIVKDTK